MRPKGRIFFACRDGLMLIDAFSQTRIVLENTAIVSDLFLKGMKDDDVRTMEYIRFNYSLGTFFETCFCVAVRR